MKKKKRDRERELQSEEKALFFLGVHTHRNPSCPGKKEKKKKEQVI